jgi:molecular chaperone HtpG
MSEANTAQSFEFQAEIKQLLDILTHSLYTHRDIFIRELISNAADALDKARFKTVKGETIADPNLDLEILIETDEKNNTLTIKDTGIGMTRDELISNLGTIARSGTSEFIKQLGEQSGNDLNLIGRFGVGFYSVFMAAENVEITSRSAEESEPPYTWISDGQGAYEIKEGPQDTQRGTSIKIFLREDAGDFSERDTVERAIKKYSNFVPFPIRINGEQVNKLSAIWREPRSSVTEEQYTEFFKFIANENEDPLTHLHISADVPIQFHSLLYVPQTNREILGFGKDDEGLHLFVRRVMVENHADDILPDYLRFVRGVLDSDDLPLNISRETLQDNAYMIKIKNVLVSKLLSHLQDVAQKDPETYEKIWKQHGRILKEGYTDFSHKDKLADLFRFESSRSKGLTSLKKVVERMPEQQDEIYYLSGPSKEAIEKNPNLEIFKSKDIEVLYCYDPVDEFALPGLIEYEKKNLVSVDQANITKLSQFPDTSESSKEDDKEKASSRDLTNLARRIKEILGDKIEDVTLSERLVDSPAVLVSSSTGMSAQMEKIMHMMDQNATPTKKVMEINRSHPLILNLLEVYKKDARDPFLDKASKTLFDSVVLLDGFLTDPHSMASDIQEILAQSSELYIKNQDKPEADQ